MRRTNSRDKNSTAESAKTKEDLTLGHDLPNFIWVGKGKLKNDVV